MAPELIRLKDYSNSVDVYSFGAIYYQLFLYKQRIKLNDSNKAPDQKTLMKRIAKGARFVKLFNMSDEQYKFYLDCTKQKPDERPTFEQLTEKFETEENLWQDNVD